MRAGTTPVTMAGRVEGGAPAIIVHAGLASLDATANQSEDDHSPCVRKTFPSIRSRRRRK